MVSDNRRVNGARDTQGVPNRWVMIYWSGLHDATHVAERRTGRVAAGMFMIAPELSGILSSDGLWETLNTRLGTLFDDWEEEALVPSQLAQAAKVVSDFCRRNYSQATDSIERVVADRVSPPAGPVVARSTGRQMCGLLEELAQFLEDSAGLGRTVEFEL